MCNELIVRRVSFKGRGLTIKTPHGISSITVTPTSHAHIEAVEVIFSDCPPRQESSSTTIKLTMAVQLQFPDGTSAEQPTSILIGGQWVAAEDGSSFETVNPYTQKPICSISKGKAADVDRAVTAARDAFPSWRKTTCARRGELLFKLATLVERDADVLAKIEVRHSISCAQHSIFGTTNKKLKRVCSPSTVASPLPSPSKQMFWPRVPVSGTTLDGEWMRPRAQRTWILANSPELTINLRST